MKDPLILKIVDIFAPLFINHNIDYSRLRLIMKMKILQTRRNPSPYFKNIKTSHKKDNNSFVYSLLFFGLMGLLFSFFIAAVSIKSLLIGSVLFFTILMFMTGYAIIIEFSLDFFNTSDQVIFLSKPMGFRELNTAKTLYIFLHMTGLAFAFSIPVLIFWASYFGVIPMITAVVGIFFALMFMLFFSTLIYSIVLNRYSGERLKDTISMMQIISAIVIFLGSQLFMNTLLEWLTTIDLTDIPVILYLLPSTWFGLPLFMTGSGYFSITAVIVACVAIALTFAGFDNYFNKRSARFEKNLYKMKIVDTKVYKQKLPIAFRFANLFKSKLNRAFYKFSVIMFTRERKLKQAIYPIMAVSLIYPVLMLYSVIREPEFNYAESKHFLFFYVNVLWWIIISVYCNFSQYNKASWIFFYLPLKSPKPLFAGAKTALFFCYQAVLILTTAVFMLVIWKFSIIINLIIMILNTFIILFCYEAVSKNVLPFSQEMKTGTNTAFGHLSYYLAVLAFTPLAVVIHYLIITVIPSVSIPFIILQAFAVIVLYKKIFNINWDELNT